MMMTMMMIIIIMSPAMVLLSFSRLKTQYSRRSRDSFVWLLRCSRKPPLPLTRSSTFSCLRDSARTLPLSSEGFKIYLFSWFEIISSSSRFLHFFGRKKVLKTKVQLIHLQKRLMTDDVELTTTRLKLDLVTRRVTKFTEEESSVFIVIGKRRRTMSLYLNKGRYGDGGKIEHRRRHSFHREKSFSSGDCSCTDTSIDYACATISKQAYKKLNICHSCDKIKLQRQIRL